MMIVQFTLQASSNHRSGLAIAEVWPAFKSTGFQKQTFVVPYGGREAAQRRDLAPGDYWVQVSMPNGEVAKELITVPEGQDFTEIVLRSAGALPSEQARPQDLGATYSFDRLDEHWAKTRPSLPIRAGSPPEQLRRLPGPGRDDQVTNRFALYRGRPWLGPAWAPLIAEQDGIVGPTRLYGSFSRGGFPIFARPFGNLSLRPREYIGEFLQRAERTPLSVEDGGTLQANSRSDNFLFSGVVEPSFTYGDQPRNRQFVLVPEGRHAALLVSIPDGLSRRSVQIRLLAEKDDPSFTVRATIEIDEPRLDSLLGFMSAGDNVAAMNLIENSIAMLYAKFENPFSAAAAGYVLIRAAPGTLKIPWQEWIGNLGYYFDNIPDGDILHATLLLQRGDYGSWVSGHLGDYNRYFPEDPDERLELAAELTLRSLGKGPPVFRPGLSLLASNLRILRASLGPHYGFTAMRSSLTQAHKLVTWMSMRVDPREIFTILRLD